MPFRFRIVFSLIISLGLVSSGWSANPQYVLQDLGTLDATGATQAMAINSKGEVAGFGDANGNEHAFRYANGTLANLGTMGGSISRAYGISDAGVIVGDADTFSSSSKIAMIYAGGQMSSIVTFGGSLSGVNGMSPNGIAVGSSRTAGDVTFRGFLRFSNGSVSQIPYINGSDTANFGYAVNDGGYSVGISRTAGGRDVAFIHGPFLVSALSLDARATGDSAAFAINGDASGAPTLIVGSANTGGFERAASLVTNAVPTDLGTLPGGTTSRALGVNVAGTVVGYSDATGTSQHGFVIPDVTTSTTMLDLNDLIAGGTTFVIYNATAINNAGQIAAYGAIPGNDSHALLLTPYVAPTPTPTSAPAAPTISAKKSLKTSKASLAIKGSASGSVTSVTYKIGSKKGSATGTNSWKFIAKLKSGKNTASIVAHGPGGDSAPFKITITRK